MRLVGGGRQHAAGVDGVLGGVGLGRAGGVVLREVGRGVVARHALVGLVGPLRGRLLVIVRMRVRGARVVRVDLRRRLEQHAGLEVRRLQPVQRRRPQLADEVVEREVRGQVLGARRRRRRRRDGVRRGRRRQGQRLPAGKPSVRLAPRHSTTNYTWKALRIITIGIRTLGFKVS